MSIKGRRERPAPKKPGRASEAEMENPFEVLALPPTLDATRVKRAYFTALPKHPPDRDPEGFRRLRVAYEALSHARELLSSFIAHPVDLKSEQARYAARFDALLQRPQGAGTVPEEASESPLARPARAESPRPPTMLGGTTTEDVSALLPALTCAEAVAALSREP